MIPIGSRPTSNRHLRRWPRAGRGSTRKRSAIITPGSIAAAATTTLLTRMVFLVCWTRSRIGRRQQALQLAPGLQAAPDPLCHTWARHTILCSSCKLASARTSRNKKVRAGERRCKRGRLGSSSKTARCFQLSSRHEGGSWVYHPTLRFPEFRNPKHPPSSSAHPPLESVTDSKR